MSFCKGGYAAVKSFLQKIDDVLATAITDITLITEKIKAIEDTLSSAGIIQAIPSGTSAETWLNQALDILLNGAGLAKTFDEKLIGWLSIETTSKARDAKIVKLAQVAVAVSDNQQHPQSFYDTAVQVHIEGLK